MGLFTKTFDKIEDKLKDNNSVRVTSQELTDKVKAWFIDATKDQKYWEDVVKTAKGANVFNRLGIKKIDSPDGKYELYVDSWEIVLFIPKIFDPLWHTIFPERAVHIEDKENKINYRLDKDKTWKKFYKQVKNMVEEAKAK